MERPSKLIVFDLDGTLNQTELFSVEVHRMVQTELGWPAQSPEVIKSIFGTPPADYVPKMLPGSDPETQQRYIRRVAEVEHDYIHLAAPYGGCREMLMRLHEDGWKTAVCSNSSYRYISMVLNAIGLMDSIDFIQPLEPDMSVKSESLRRLLQKVLPESSIMVGDTSFDAIAAQENNIPFIGCRYGFRPEEMETERYRVKAPLEIPGLVKQIVR